MDQFVRQYYAQVDKHALIVDERWNGGGFIDQILLERLRRVLAGMDTNREAATTTVPQQLIHGPKICMINHYSGSDGDIFPVLLPQVRSRSAAWHPHVGRGARHPRQLAAARRRLHHDSRGRAVRTRLPVGDREPRGRSRHSRSKIRRQTGWRGTTCSWRRPSTTCWASSRKTRWSAAASAGAAGVSTPGPRLAAAVMPWIYLAVSGC